MALTIKENFNATVGGRRMKWFTITHDDSTTTLSADLLDLDVVEWAGFSFGTQTSAQAAQLTMTLAANGKTIEFSEALKASSFTPIMVIGW